MIATFRKMTLAHGCLFFETLQGRLLLSLLLMTLLGMILPGSAPMRAVFWLFFVPLSIYMLAKNKYRSFGLNDSSFLLCIAIVAITMLSVLWSDPFDEKRASKAISRGLQTLIFITGYFVALGASSSQRQAFAKTLIGICITAVFINIVYLYSIHPLHWRLDGLGLLAVATIGPTALMGTFLSALLLLESESAKNKSLWIVGGFLFVFLFVFLTQSRGPLISLLFLMFAYSIILLGRVKGTIVFFTVILAGVAFILLSKGLDQSWVNRVNRSPFGSRPTIWLVTLQHSLERPFLGFGIASNFSDTKAGILLKEMTRSNIPHPHGLFPYVIYTFGLFGLFFQIALILQLIKRCLSCNSRIRSIGVIAIVFILLMTATDLHVLTGSVGYIWWMYWMPLLTLIFITNKKHEIDY